MVNMVWPLKGNNIGERLENGSDDIAFVVTKLNREKDANAMAAQKKGKGDLVMCQSVRLKPSFIEVHWMFSPSVKTVGN